MQTFSDRLRTVAIFGQYSTASNQYLSTFDYTSANNITFYPSDIREGRCGEIRRKAREERVRMLEAEAALINLVVAGKASFFPQEDQEYFLEVKRRHDEQEKAELAVIVKSRTTIERSWRLLQRAKANGAKQTARKHRRNIRAAVQAVTDLYYDQHTEMAGSAREAASEFRQWVAKLTGSKDWADSLLVPKSNEEVRP